MRRWILASSSPRRREILGRTGHPLELASPGEVEEGVGEGPPARQAVQKARAKALAVASSLREPTPCLVIGADTVADLGGALIGKPTDRADARRILGQLAGTRHDVITGLFLWLHPEERGLELAEVSTVWMRPLGAAEVAAYVDSGEADGKAGAYAIQETGDRFVERVVGSWLNVVGFPLERFLELVERERLR